MTRWRGGDAATRSRIERWLAGDETGARVVHENARRAVVVLDESLAVKHFKTGQRHAARERLKALLGRSPAEREHAALRALSRAGVAVPEPLGLARLPGGDRLLALRYHAGASTAELLAGPASERRAGLRALGRTVASLHQAGWVHGDLHGGNVLFTGAGVLLLDLQHARRRRSSLAREADLGGLDYSLWGRASLPDRLRVRFAALDCTQPLTLRDMAKLRDIGDAARERAFRHGQSRTRRALRPGRRFAALRLGSKRGLRAREFAADEAARALEAHREALAAGDTRVLVDDGRSRVTRVEAGRPVIVKEVLAGGAARRIANLLRGSPARRAWRAGHGLGARGIGAARPLAFVEQRSLGLSHASAVVLEDLAPARDALETEADPAVVLDALVRIATKLHLREVHHGDLKATHVFLRPTEAGLEPHLIDLEGTRFGFSLSEDQRLDTLAQLNASLPDRFPAHARRAAFDRYFTVHRFARGKAWAVAEIVRRSLERRHRWTGSDCPEARAQQDAEAGD